MAKPDLAFSCEYFVRGTDDVKCVILRWSRSATPPQSRRARPRGGIEAARSRRHSAPACCARRKVCPFWVPWGTSALLDLDRGSTPGYVKSTHRAGIPGMTLPGRLTADGVTHTGVGARGAGMPPRKRGTGGRQNGRALKRQLPTRHAPQATNCRYRAARSPCFYNQKQLVRAIRRRYLESKLNATLLSEETHTDVAARRVRRSLFALSWGAPRLLVPTPCEERRFPIVIRWF